MNYAWGCWYVSIVSIIFDCSMPIFFNFHILLATFYIIFGTNILIQCLVPVHVCCMFYVSQKPNIKRSPNGIKRTEIFLEYLWFLGSKINARRCPRGPGDRGAPKGGRRALDSPGLPIRRLTLFFCHKKANFMGKIWAKDSPQSELRISRYKGNGEGVESGNAETER